MCMIYINKISKHLFKSRGHVDQIAGVQNRYLSSSYTKIFSVKCVEGKTCFERRFVMNYNILPNTCLKNWSGVSAANRLIGEVVQSRNRPLLALSHLRHY